LGIESKKKGIMKKWKPEASYTGYHHTGQRYVDRAFPTYRELKKAMPEMLKDSKTNVVRVCRWRNNAEWIEIWGMEEGKPRIVKQGYM
jgi:hypothetical protein